MTRKEKKSKEKLHLLNRESVKIKPGNYRTYIAPPGVSDILDMFSWNGIGESSIRQGQSALIKLRNEGSLSNCFSLTEDSTGFRVARVWTDEMWTDAQSVPAPTIGNGWTRTATFETINEETSIITENLSNYGM